VAHDFNNMLTVILGHAELGLIRLDPAHPVHAGLQEISKTAERSAELTRQLLVFARKQTIAPKVLNLNEVVTSMLKMLERLIGEDIQLDWQPGTDLWLVNIDPSQIDQILANLCVNARDSISDIGRVTIETGNRIIDESYSSGNIESKPGEYVTLTVCDDGCGMDKETEAHIFEPFFTTKGSGKGTGLGLASVFGAVKQNNGFINVYSEEGLGTKFTIHLPRHLGNSAPTQTKSPVETVPRGNETILLVEDEPAILSMALMMLTEQGYVVLASQSPLEAIRIAGEHANEIHLLITDVVMPEMNGRDLANKLLANYPQLKCLFMSGYTSDIITHRGVLDEGVHFIQKPFTLPGLASKVREVLEANQANNSERVIFPGGINET
jgi:CheY-like chemotaxis protein